MRRVIPLSRFAAAGVVIVTLASACGGKSFSNDAGESGSGGTQGGATSTAGTHSGGKANAGSGGNGAVGNAGSGNGGEAATGAGGGKPDGACTDPPTANLEGGCLADFAYWWHDPKTGICMPISYGGCGGTKNLYKTLEECQKACPASGQQYDACEVSTDCMLGSPGCCGVCDDPSVTTHDFIAYNKQYAGQVSTCEGGVSCGACAPPMGPSTIQAFIPNCVNHRCIVEDVRTSDVTACRASDECKVRAGYGCCESCNGDDAIAVRNDGSFEKLVCGNLQPPCSACMPSLQAVATCGASGHCEVVELQPTPTPAP